MSDTPRRINALKGFADTLPADARKWQFIEDQARATARVYHFDEIRTPVLEDAALFHRGVGETSDMVRKETYTFTDRDGSLVTLRPEGTAGVTRAVLEGGLLNDQGARVKVFYLTSNFRHEKPQRGRLRQHHQFGVEAYGIAEPEQDVECIQLQLEFYRRCGLTDLSLRANSLGDRESKQRYRDALVSFLGPKRNELSEDSQRRLETNPLRILDSKDKRDIVATAGAPSASDSLSERSKTHFARVIESLTKSDVPFVLDGTLVRGFDYYTDTLWEVTAGGHGSGLGSQDAVGGGGRYDNLVEQLGGKPTPAVGFGIGLERLLLSLGEFSLPVESLIWLVSNGEAAREANLQLLATLRINGFVADMDFSRRAFKGQMKVANRENATTCIIVGDDELAAGTVAVKDFTTGSQTSVPLTDFDFFPAHADMTCRSSPIASSFSLPFATSS